MKKRLLGIVFSISLLWQMQAAEIWVSTAGSDANPGSPTLPKATLQAALRQARELRRLNDPSVQGGIRILMKGGVYTLNETLLITPEDSGTPDGPTTVEAADGESPILSGGVAVTGWQPLKGRVPGLKKGLYVWTAELPLVGGRRLDFRQVWVNGVKAQLASSSGSDDMLRILSVDAKNRAIRIPLEQAMNFVHPDEMELFIHQMWATAVLRVASVQVQGKEALLRFHEPESTLEFEHPWPPPVISPKGNSAFILRKAIEFLDEPGEWYHDRRLNRLYYLPRAGESLAEAEVVVPTLETLVRVEGTLERPVHDLIFKGLGFAYSNWLRPSQMGDVPLQAGMYLLDAYKLQVPGTPDKATLENQAWVGRQPAAVMLSRVRKTAFLGCTFEHTGAAGLDYLEACRGDRIEDNHFTDIAGNGLVLGRFSDPCVEAHLPYDPTDQRELAQGTLIRNNLMEDVANEYWGCCGILAGYVRDVTIEHNELRNLSYSGISLGWGWTRTVNAMRNNRIHANLVHDFGRHNYSCGGIYTLSAQPGTSITENAVSGVPHLDYAHDTTDYRIYLDEASSYMLVRDNWTDVAKFGFNQNGLNLFENNGPQVSEAVRQRAGLEKNAIQRKP
jgi:hypothetical protein